VTRRSWYFLIGLAFALHNSEEAIAAPRMLAMMQARGPALLRAFYSGIEVAELRVSLFILTALGLFLTLMAARNEESTGSAYTMLVFAALIGLNALMHIALAVTFRTYMPGLITAILLTLPLSLLVLSRAFRERWVPTRAYWSVIPAAVVVHGPLLAAFIIGTTRIARVFVGS
jgi:hypothetical protein